ncbi:hypothetical protein BO79DRAFT_288199 [Aspergillus costaricaensis CBS 115574]|uniref:Uncharacterized protein n=1 Tax=Aspergillus costaricaensis CBS 115574 TaxID=1448317 RepID=A0ACD1IBE7_9EURO|nr:hypothetical protein BO79DRAFT_288199 [Aspergillus costaricaensis CBS 115574]RAK87892.1 hypothetical protein BO79DRAFT_288199 [Aspergillus costaricaensis CBS 115574]
MYAFSTKRQRDQEQEDFDGNVFRETKKHRSLPLRASPSALQFSSLPQSNRLASGFGFSTLTPVESSDDDKEDNGADKFAHHGSTQPRDQPLPSEQGCIPIMSASMDIDNGKDAQCSTNNVEHSNPGSVAGYSNYSLQPSPIPHSLVDQSLVISEEPTTHSTEGNTPAPRSPVVRDMVQNSTSYTSQGVSRGPYASHDRVWWCGQRLPSPVSDNGDAMAISSKDSVSDADMTYMSQPASPPPWYSETTPDVLQPAGSMGSLKREQHIPSSSKKKAAISMGYRADCDKCRRRVPGHYSHIIRH